MDDASKMDTEISNRKSSEPSLDKGCGYPSGPGTVIRDPLTSTPARNAGRNCDERWMDHDTREAHFNAPYGQASRSLPSSPTQLRHRNNNMNTDSQYQYIQDNQQLAAPDFSNLQNISQIRSQITVPEQRATYEDFEQNRCANTRVDVNLRHGESGYDFAGPSIYKTALDSRTDHIDESVRYTSQKPDGLGKVKDKKEKKSISTKTFAHGMMDVSLLTSNATQLRAIMANPQHDFYTFLIWLIAFSIVLQIVSGVLLIMSDFFKTQVKEKDRQNQRKRKLLNFIALAMVVVITSLNILISAFYAPVAHSNPVVASEVVQEMPQFSPTDFSSAGNHTEL